MQGYIFCSNFASAFAQKLSKSTKKEFFDRIKINRQVVQEASALVLGAWVKTNRQCLHLAVAAGARIVFSADLIKKDGCPGQIRSRVPCGFPAGSAKVYLYNEEFDPGSG